jgi:hypothetical protein
MRNDEWGGLYPIDLTPGWYTIKVKIDYSNNTINMKTWKDGQNEPVWQLSDAVNPDWHPKLIGFRHYGQGSIVDDLIVVEAP